jgi:hypothetical protein
MPFFIKNVEPLSDRSSSRLEILHGAKKNTFGGKTKENKPSESKNGIWGPKSIWSCDRHIHRSRISHRSRKNILLGVKKVKISLQSPKPEFGAQNGIWSPKPIWSCDISIVREFYME